MGYSYDNRLNQLEELDAADLDTLDVLHDLARHSKEIEVSAEEILGIERVIKTLAQLHRNERSRADRYERMLTDREIELGEADDKSHTRHLGSVRGR